MEKFTYKQMSSNEATFWWYVARRKLIKKTIASLDLSTTTILEVGSGTGGNVDLLSDLGKYTGIEMEPLAINLAHKKNPNAKFIQGSVPVALNQLEGTYDLIILLDVLEHIENDSETLNALKPLLNENGCLLITTPAFPSLWSYHDIVHHHYRRYTHSMIKELARNSGLQIKYSTYFNFFLFPIIVIIRFFNKTTKRKSTDDKPTFKPINYLLTKIFGFESYLIPKIRFPFGLSHLVVLNKIKNYDK